MKYKGLLIAIGVCAATAAMVIAAVAWYRFQAKHRYVYIPSDIQITIPEGTNIGDLDALLSETGIIKKGELLTPAYLAFEGTFFPDTYRFEKNTGAETVAARMREQYDKIIADNQLAITSDALSIASMLEEEVRTEQDMRLVSGIIQKRLALGMPLQIDAAVAYGVCAARFARGAPCDVSQISIVDNIKIDLPYNTYSRLGLPAGPITNPGLRALRAALNPQKSDYLYYLSAPDGKTIFSKTAAEHTRARQKYLLR